MAATGLLDIPKELGGNLLSVTKNIDPYALGTMNLPGDTVSSQLSTLLKPGTDATKSVDVSGLLGSSSTLGTSTGLLGSGGGGGSAPGGQSTLTPPSEWSPGQVQTFINQTPGYTKAQWYEAASQYGVSPETMDRAFILPGGVNVAQESVTGPTVATPAIPPPEQTPKSASAYTAQDAIDFMMTIPGEHTDAEWRTYGEQQGIPKAILDQVLPSTVAAASPPPGGTPPLGGTTPTSAATAPHAPGWDETTQTMYGADGKPFSGIQGTTTYDNGKMRQGFWVNPETGNTEVWQNGQFSYVNRYKNPQDDPNRVKPQTVEKLPEVAPAKNATASIATVAPPVRPGLIDTFAPVTANTASAVQAQFQGYTPETITPEQQKNMTVLAQMQKYLDTGSPVVQQLTAAAAEQANARGMLNSTAFAQLATQAMTQFAVQAGTQDANMLYNVAVQNMGQKNAALAFTANAFNQASATNAQLGTQVNIENARSVNQTIQFNVATALDIMKTNVNNALQADVFNAQQVNDIAKLNANLLTTVNLSNVKTANDFTQMVFSRAVDLGIANMQQVNAVNTAMSAQQTQRDIATMQVTSTETLETKKLALQAQLSEDQIDASKYLQERDADLRTLLQKNQISADKYLQEKNADLQTLLADNQISLSKYLQEKNADLQTLLQNQQIDATAVLAAARNSLEADLEAKRITNAQFMLERQKQWDSAIDLQRITSTQYLAEKQQAFESDLQAKRITSAEGLAAKARDLEGDLQAKRITSAEFIAGLQAQTTLTASANNLQASVAVAAMHDQTSRAVASMEDATKRDLAQFAAETGRTSDVSRGAVSLMGNTSQLIYAIMGNELMDGPAKNAAIGVVMDNQWTSLETLGALNGIIVTRPKT